MPPPTSLLTPLLGSKGEGKACALRHLGKRDLDEKKLH